MTPLHQVGHWIRDTLGQVPLPAVRVLFVALLVALLLWVLRLPRHETLPAVSTGRRGENLKLWAGLALMIQIAIYCFI